VSAWDLHPEFFNWLQSSFLDLGPRLFTKPKQHTDIFGEFYSVKDSLTLNWSELEGVPFVYENFANLAVILRKLKKDKARILCVVPIWVNRPWWRKVIHHAVDVPWLLPRRSSLYVLNNRSVGAPRWHSALFLLDGNAHASPAIKRKQKMMKKELRLWSYTMDDFSGRTSAPNMKRAIPNLKKFDRVTFDNLKARRKPLNISKVGNEIPRKRNSLATAKFNLLDTGDLGHVLDDDRSTDDFRSDSTDSEDGKRVDNDESDEEAFITETYTSPLSNKIFELEHISVDRLQEEVLELQNGNFEDEKETILLNCLELVGDDPHDLETTDDVTTTPQNHEILQLLISDTDCSRVIPDTTRDSLKVSEVSDSKDNSDLWDMSSQTPSIKHSFRIFSGQGSRQATTRAAIPVVELDKIRNSPDGANFGKMRHPKGNPRKNFLNEKASNPTGVAAKDAFLETEKNGEKNGARSFN